MEEPNTEVDENGYVRFRNTGKYFHRWVMERHLKRRLEIGEVVHHIDGDRQNNNRENLALMNWEEHRRLHKHQTMLNKKTAKFIMTAFAVAGVILLVVGLMTGAKLDLWYTGLVFVLAALVAWYFVLGKWRTKRWKGVKR